MSHLQQLSCCSGIVFETFVGCYSRKYTLINVRSPIWWERFPDLLDGFWICCGAEPQTALSLSAFTDIPKPIPRMHIKEVSTEHTFSSYDRIPDDLLSVILFVLFCFVLFCFVLSCLVLSCLVLSCLVLPCLVLSCLVCLFVCLFVCLLVCLSVKIMSNFQGIF